MIFAVFYPWINCSFYHLYYFINYKIMAIEVLFIIGLKITSVIDSSIVLSIMCPLVLLVMWNATRIYIGATFVFAVCK